MEKTTKILMKEMREEIAKKIEAIDLGGTSQINALGMKIIAAEIARNLFNEKNSNGVEYKN